MVTREQAIEISKLEFTKRGYVVAEYDLTVDPENTNTDYWMVWFEKKGPFQVPGGSHAVRVHKTNANAEFMRGE